MSNKETKNFRPKRGLGSAVTRQRRKAAEGARAASDARVQREMASARAEIERAKQARATKPLDITARWHDSLLQSVVRNQSAVAKAYGHYLPVRAIVSPHREHIVAWTDFRQIAMEWPKTMMPKYGSNQDVVRDTVTKMKGVFQHELGHVRFTTAWPTICNNPDVVQSPNHDWRVLVGMWNGLEDQRMEGLVIEKVPRIRNYFIPMVNVHILSDPDMLPQAWKLIAGRQYLPSKVRRISWSLFNDYCLVAGVEHGATKYSNIVRRYIAANDHQTLYDCVVEAYDFLKEVNAAHPQPEDDHSRMGDNGDQTPGNGREQSDDIGKGMSGDVREAPAKPDKYGEKGKGKGKGEGEGEGEGNDGKDAKRSNHKDHYKNRGLNPVTNQQAPEAKDEKWIGGQSNDGGAGNEVFTPQDLMDALEETVEEAKGIASQDADVREMIRGASEMHDTPGLPDYVGSGELMSAEYQAESASIAVGIEQALESFVTATSPVWHNRVNHGVIDALAYRTKEIGSQNFHRMLEDHGNSGLDLHLSVLADVSYSMQPYMGQLSKFMYAAGLACMNLGINHTFSLWSSAPQNHRIWQNGISPEIFPAMGGTDPTEALDDLVNHNTEEATTHLVLVFTDGEWAHGFPSLTRWQDEGRKIVFIRYGAGTKECPNMGADSHILINKLDELPFHLVNELSDALAGSLT